MKKKQNCFYILLLSALLLFGGCGGGGDASSSAASSQQSASGLTEAQQEEPAGNEPENLAIEETDNEALAENGQTGGDLEEPVSASEALAKPAGEQQESAAKQQEAGEHTPDDQPSLHQPAIEEPATNQQTVERSSNTADRGNPEIEPAEAASADLPAATCTISVSCAVLLENKDAIDESLWELIPADGMILPATTVALEEGDTVFDVLSRSLRQAEIPFEFSKTPAYGSVYIEGINNIYEFDAGSLSGWSYAVNGEFPSVGCSSVTVSDGDAIEWVYSLDAY